MWVLNVKRERERAPQCIQLMTKAILRHYGLESGSLGHSYSRQYPLMAFTPQTTSPIIEDGIDFVFVLNGNFPGGGLSQQKLYWVGCSPGTIITTLVVPSYHFMQSQNQKRSDSPFLWQGQRQDLRDKERPRSSTGGDSKLEAPMKATDCLQVGKSKHFGAFYLQNMWWLERNVEFD